MTDNLIICCSFTDVESEQGIRYALGLLGEAVQVMPSVWYVPSSYDAGDAAEMIRSVTDAPGIAPRRERISRPSCMVQSG